jgi:hypothetical protein
MRENGDVVEIWDKAARRAGACAVIVAIGGGAGTLGVATIVGQDANSGWAFGVTLAIGAALTATAYALVSAVEAYARAAALRPPPPPADASPVLDPRPADPRPDEPET